MKAEQKIPKFVDMWAEKDSFVCSGHSHWSNVAVEICQGRWPKK